jgi:hypothetical protein
MHRGTPMEQLAGIGYRIPEQWELGYVHTLYRILNTDPISHPLIHGKQFSVLGIAGHVLLCQVYIDGHPETVSLPFTDILTNEGTFLYVTQ